jgi:hypothetical protein
MNSKLQWGYDNSLMLWIELYKSWTWADFHNVIRKAHEMINTVNQEVSLVVWYQDQPPAGDMLSHFKSVEEHQPANLARTIVIECRNYSLYVPLKQQKRCFRRRPRTAVRVK